MVIGICLCRFCLNMNVGWGICSESILFGMMFVECYYM